MNIEPLVSIGIPTYNRPEELRRCLEGIVGQTYPNLEVIVSDNATPNDLTAEVVREFMRRDSRIQYFRQTENQGAMFNFQFVLDNATGGFFMWAGDDDYRAPTFVETLVGLMLECPECAIAFCDFQEVDESGVKAEGYPHHYLLLSPFTTRNKLVRLAHYMFQLESNGKANLLYGLMRKTTLTDFNWNEFVREHGEYGADMLFVYTLLRHGRLALSEQSLYRCTVGNKKEYAAAAPSNSREKLGMSIVGLGKQLRYSAQYLLIEKGWTRLVLCIGWPIKAIDIIARLFLVAGIKYQYRKMLRDRSH